ncbi:hypothetical protein [Streptomyces sp. NPDC001678]|uniref:hypothetical protein n=1 Tax=Streptomyces sp. NPDC001678 TaxID=3364599 RepID=UPI00369BA8EB
MNAPGHALPKRRPPGRAKAIAIRVFVCVVAWGSIGVCSWAPLLRLAMVRRQRRDWAAFWVVLLLCLCCLVTIEDHFAGTLLNKVGGYTLLALIFLVVPYYLWNEIQHYRDLDRQPPVAPAFPPTTAPYPPTTAPFPATVPVPAAGPFGVPPRPAPRPDPFAEFAEGARRTPPPAGPQRPASPRIDEVRAELDELSALLREEPRDRKEHGQ